MTIELRQIEIHNADKLAHDALHQMQYRVCHISSNTWVILILCDC
jgi:hypothetical protein